MSSPEHRASLEAQMRKKYMRMKTINNHETVKLSKTLEGLHKYTVTSLEHHLQHNTEISNLWNRCSTTTGWFDGAIKPGRRDIRNIMDTELRAKTTPWAYSSGGTIEMWEKHPPMRIPIRRPKTALGTYSIKPNQGDETDRLKRPMTVSGTRNESPGHALPPELMDHDSSIRLRAKSARVHINTQAFHSPRLDDKGVKANMRPITAGPLLGGRKANMIKEKYGKQGQKAMARPVKSAIQPRNRGDSFADDVFMDSVDGPPPKHITKVEIVKKSEDQQKPRPTSVRFSRMSSSLSLHKRMSNQAGSEVSRSDRGSSKHHHDDSSDDDDEQVKNKENAAKLPKWNMPKFYVKPQDRYKMDDMFLMRRFTLLQRQLNAEVPPEVIQGNDKLQMNVLFSSMARKSKLKHLTEENSQKLKTDQKRNYRDTGLKQRLDKFMDEIDKYIESQKEQQ